MATYQAVDEGVGSGHAAVVREHGRQHGDPEHAAHLPKRVVDSGRFALVLRAHRPEHDVRHWGEEESVPDPAHEPAAVNARLRNIRSGIMGALQTPSQTTNATISAAPAPSAATIRVSDHPYLLASITAPHPEFTLELWRTRVL